MAEMTVEEAVRTAWKFNQPGLVRFIECQESKAKLMSQQIEHCTALLEQQAAEIERLKVENKRLRVCGNCRHFSTGYLEDFCANGCGTFDYKKETLRQNTCRDWEMV